MDNLLNRLRETAETHPSRGMRIDANEAASRIEADAAEIARLKAEVERLTEERDSHQRLAISAALNPQEPKP